MKKGFLVVLMMLLSFGVFAENKSGADKSNEPNGTLIEEGELGGHKFVAKVHNQSLVIGSSAMDYHKIIYKDVTCKKEIGKLKEGDKINISQLVIVDDKKTLLKISVNKIEGYILYSTVKEDYYADGKWMYDETLQSGDKTYHTKKNQQNFLIYENLKIREVPGLSGKQIGLIKASNANPVSVVTQAITDEKDCIDNKTERWAKVEYNGITGWVFGGYLAYERGGPRFNDPMIYIEMSLGDGI